MARRVFTVAEVRGLIPLLEGVLVRMRGHLEALRALHDKLQLLDVLWGERVEAPGNPDHGEWSEYRAEVDRHTDAARALVEREIVARGIRFPQGGLEHGLLDFPTTYQGRWVYLCWRSGEPTVATWHEIDGGFAGRRPLTPEVARAMGTPEESGLPDDSVLDF
jgi:hypothetical protein